MARTPRFNSQSKCTSSSQRPLCCATPHRWVHFHHCPAHGKPTLGPLHSRSTPHSLPLSRLAQVGWWDEKKQDWTTNGISEVKVETVASGENGVLRFHTVHVGHFRMVQPRNLDIPYHYWEVKPHGSKGALMLIIITKHHENGAQRVCGCVVVVVAAGSRPSSPTRQCMF